VQHWAAVCRSRRSCPWGCPPTVMHSLVAEASDPCPGPHSPQVPHMQEKQVQACAQHGVWWLVAFPLKRLSENSSWCPLCHQLFLCLSQLKNKEWGRSRAHCSIGDSSHTNKSPEHTVTSWKNFQKALKAALHLGLGSLPILLKNSSYPMGSVDFLHCETLRAPQSLLHPRATKSCGNQHSSVLVLWHPWLTCAGQWGWHWAWLLLTPAGSTVWAHLTQHMKRHDF
jgi:hypothetical protein